MTFAIKQRDACRWDCVSLGEVMLRFDPGDYRIWTTRQFAVSEGGGEYNVARGLKRCFGLESSIVTAIAKNPIGLLLQDLIYQGGVDSSLIRWLDYDGVGRTVGRRAVRTRSSRSRRAPDRRRPSPRSLCR